MKVKVNVAGTWRDAGGDEGGVGEAAMRPSLQRPPGQGIRFGFRSQDYMWASEGCAHRSDVT